MTPEQLGMQLQKAQQQARVLLGLEYATKIELYKELISGVRKYEQVDVLDALLKCCEYPEIRNNQVSVILLTAAAVDIIEIEAEETETVKN